MLGITRIRRALALALFVVIAGLAVYFGFFRETRPGEVDVLTQRNDIARSGLNLHETLLNTGNVRQGTFGKLFSRAVDDELYAQLLIVSGLRIPKKGLRNVVFAATVSNSIYAFDADDPKAGEPLWHVNYTPDSARPTRAADMTGACGGDYRDFSGNIGIVSTPAIDKQTLTMFFVTRTYEAGGHVQRLHAVDITDGRERPNSPVVITAKIAGSGDGSDKGVLTFEPLRHNQRAALLLLDGIVYLAWAGHCDWPPYHGWVAGYDATTLEQVVVWNVTPDGSGGGIWQSGQGLASDGTYIYAVSGNGTIGEKSDMSSLRNRGQSIMKLARAGGTLKVVTWFTPYDWERLERYDFDLGSAGLLLIPNSHLGVSGGKGGTVYVVDIDNMGGLSSSGSDNNIVQSFVLTAPNYNLLGTPLYWDGPDGGRIFFWAEKDTLKSFPFLGERYAIPSTVLDIENVELGDAWSEWPGGFLTLSADGKVPGAAVLWASMSFSSSANHEVQPGILRAYDANNVGRELWNNRTNEVRDSCGSFSKFSVPTVANGKVYLGSFSNQFCVYGLLE